MTTAEIDIPDELIAALDAALRGCAKGFICRANKKRDFCEIEDQSEESHSFGNLWKEQDYAWRVLINPSFQAEVMLALANCDDREVANEQLDQVGPVLDALSAAMPDDAIINLMTEGDDVAEVLADKLHAYFLRVKPASRMTRTASGHAFSPA